MRLVRPLDRYVFTEWVKIFLATSVGLPILLVIIDLTDHLPKYLGRNIAWPDIALSYLYWMPQSMFMSLPPAVLFATVFSIGTFTRHSEITAAKASGISFYRLVAPIVLGAMLAAGLDVVIGELVPITDVRRNDLLKEGTVTGGNSRYNFAFAAEYGRVYKARELDVKQGTMEQLLIERKGRGADYPTVIVASQGAKYLPSTGGWTLRAGEMHIIRDSAPDVVMGFSALQDSRMRERPVELMAAPRSPQEMRFRELSRFITSLERSGGDASMLRVERMLKIAIPVTCLVIALFGAPLATSSQRGGTAYGIGVSLATTITFLMLIQLTKAVGGKAIVSPDAAAWIPNILFGIMGLYLLTRVRT